MNADELRERVIHMELLVMQNLFEDRARGRIAFDCIAIDGESRRRIFFGDMQKREHRFIALLVDAQIVETMSGRRSPREWIRRARSMQSRAEKVRRVPAKDLPVTILVG